MTLEDIPGNPFAIATVVMRRASQIAGGAEPRVRIATGENVVSIAMREVKAGVVGVPETQ